jgi:hypothetical protein
MPDEQLYAANKRWITAGELRDYLALFPADMPVTVGIDYGADWLNLIGATDPRESGDDSIILMTRNDFDTRQW